MCSISDVFRALANVKLIKKLSASDLHPTVIVRIAAAAYGGTESSCAVVDS